MDDEQGGIACPFCGHKEFEKVHVGVGEPLRWWRPGDIARRLVLFMAGKIDMYRCERCHYVMMFARD